MAQTTLTLKVGDVKSGNGGIKPDIGLSQDATTRANKIIALAGAVVFWCLSCEDSFDSIKRFEEREDICFIYTTVCWLVWNEMIRDAQAS